ncbi:MAG: hypothetical protein F6K47_32270 [Symploca sp. SIO2E6]|nr:hypothetical protein [Symploca sp. SIO2E6]
MSKKVNGRNTAIEIQDKPVGANGNSPVQREQTVVQIGGKVFVQKPLAANVYFEYQRRITAQSPSIAIEWLMYEAYGLSDEQFGELKFRERGRLQSAIASFDAEVTCHDDLPFSETSDFSVMGHRYTEKPNSGDYYTKFVQQAGQGAIAYKEAIQNLFLIDGKAIEEKDLLNQKG